MINQQLLNHQSKLYQNTFANYIYITFPTFDHKKPSLKLFLLLCVKFLIFFQLE